MNQRDIILIKFPFSDLSGYKVRPALILSSDNYNKSVEDILICAITSNIKEEKYSVIISRENMEDGTLKTQSKIKADTIASIDKSLLIKRIGKLNTGTFDKVIGEITSLIKRN